MRLFIWDKRDDLVRKEGICRRGTVIVLAECLPGAIALVKNPKASGLEEDTVTDQIHNLPDVNVPVSYRSPGAWAFHE